MGWLRKRLCQLKDFMVSLRCSMTGLGDVAGKFGFGIDAKLLPLRRLLAATPVEGTFLSEGNTCDRLA